MGNDNEGIKQNEIIIKDSFTKIREKDVHILNIYHFKEEHFIFQLKSNKAIIVILPDNQLIQSIPNCHCVLGVINQSKFCFFSDENYKPFRVYNYNNNHVDKYGFYFSNPSEIVSIDNDNNLCLINGNHLTLVDLRNKTETLIIHKMLQRSINPEKDKIKLLKVNNTTILIGFYGIIYIVDIQLHQINLKVYYTFIIQRYFGPIYYIEMRNGRIIKDLINSNKHYKILCPRFIDGDWIFEIDLYQGIKKIFSREEGNNIHFSNIRRLGNSLYIIACVLNKVHIFNGSNGELVQCLKIETEIETVCCITEKIMIYKGKDGCFYLFKMKNIETLK